MDRLSGALLDPAKPSLSVCSGHSSYAVFRTRPAQCPLQTIVGAVIGAMGNGCFQSQGEGVSFSVWESVVLH
jgi:hypothetical protein